MNIKKVDDKPMVIHTKEKTKIHVKSAPEVKIKSAGKNHKGIGKEPDKNAPSVKGSTKAKKETGKPAQKESGVQGRNASPMELSLGMMW